MAVKTLHSEADRHALVARLRTLSPTAKPLWGRMTAPQMLAHLVEGTRMATGELPVKPKKVFARFWPVKQLIIYVVPFPRSTPTAPELLARIPTEWNGELEEVIQGLSRFVEKPVASEWPDHPIFGSMSHRDWSALAYKHTDHHLRQFGA